MTREEAIALRLTNQCLINSPFEKPEEVVEWMGMMQAQDYNYFRWAIGMRMKEPQMKAVKDSFSSGKMLRLHLFRCTVQVTTPEDYPWMVELCRERNLSTIKSWPSYNQTDFSEQYYQEGTEALKSILSQSHNTIGYQEEIEAISTHTITSLSKKEISEEMAKIGLPSDTAHLNQILLRGEVEGFLCSGEMKGKDGTWALVSERLRNTTTYSESEILALLARKYFRSHSPATFEDFCWWTGLPITQCRKAIEQIAPELEEVKIGNPLSKDEEQTMFIYTTKTACCKNAVHLLPPYDEYLIGYKSRWISLDKKHEAKAHNRFGIFKPVILYEGKVVGNWKASLDQRARNIETELFTKKREIGVRRLQQAEKKLQDFTTSL